MTSLLFVNEPWHSDLFTHIYICDGTYGVAHLDV